MAESNKTEKATPKKKKDERKKGNAYQSKDVISIVVLIVGFVAISKVGAFTVLRIRELYLSQLEKMGSVYDLTISGCMQIFREAAFTFTITTVPIIIILAVTGIVMTGLQTGFLVSGDLVRPKFSRISFIEGSKRLISLRSLVQLIKSLLKVVVIMWLIYQSVKDILLVTPDMLNTSLGNNISFMMDRVMAMVYKICILFVGVAIIDFAYQKYDYEKKLRMSKQEIKDEYKQTEGDPFIKGQIRQKQRKMSMNRMIQQVPDADLIVRNPTHFAVALKYDIDKDLAPIVLAKGQDSLALRIIKIGEKNNVLITENRPLARALYETVEVNSYIPAEFYQTVAELMAWVYGNKGKDKGKKQV